MKISYINVGDHLNINNSSGIPYFLGKCLELQKFDIDNISNLRKKENLILKFKRFSSKINLNKKVDFNRDLSLSKFYSNQVSLNLRSNSNVIFSTSTIPIAFLESNKPKLVYTDATFGGMLNYYDSFSNLSNKSINNGNYIEQLALDNSTIVLFPSDWASKSAIEMYNIKLDKIKVVPFGANLRTTFSFHEIKNIIKCRSRDKLNLLFIGVDWVRKGGDIALEITNKLNQQGINTTLHVVGLKYKPINSKFIINHGIINKSTNEDYFIELFKMSHFLLVPSFAECYGLVFCEANSIGLPALSHNTGGISTIIRDDLNGKMFNIFSDIDLWVNYIAKLFEDRKSYENLCISSFYEYQTRLNWGVAGKTINNLLKDL